MARRESEGSADAIQDPLAFTQLLINVLDEGRRTATYKLAVVLGLLDCCLLQTDALGRAPLTIATRDLALAVVALYWSQVRPFPVEGSDDVSLRQSSGGRALIVEAVRELRRSAESVGVHSAQQADIVLPELVSVCLDAVELNLVRMPLGRLQRPGTFSAALGDYPRFLYDDRSFHEGISRARLKKAPMAIDLMPQVGEWLVSLNSLLRPFLELHWTRAVAKYNAHVIGHDRLRDFLFGANRIALSRIVSGLRALQGDGCFYCSGDLTDKPVEVDHFIPWSRMPNDALANLVLADRRCNNNKRDHLPAIPLVEAWARRPHDVLAVIASDAKWPLGVSQTTAIARASYAHLPVTSQLWAGPSQLVTAASADIRRALAALT